MSRTLNAFICAAGIGERLRPITEYIPKPLLPVLGRPLLASILERISALPVESIGINLHYKPDAIREWVEASAYRERVTFFPEESLLDTGGALKNAEHLLDGGPFVVHNGDILTDIDLHALVEAHVASGNIATLALYDCPRLNNVAVRENGVVVGARDVMVGSGASRILAFASIAVYDPAFFAYLPEGKSSAVDAWMAAIAAGHTVGSIDFTGSVWHDMGTPASYAAAVVDALRRDGGWIHVAAGVNAADVNLDGYVVLEDGCALGDGATLRNCIALPGARIDNKAVCENSIVGEGFTVPLKEPEFLGLPISEHGVQIGVGGSGRRYYRAWNDQGTIVRMVCLPDEPDYERHMAYSRFFARHGVPVPKVLGFDATAKRAEFEDLGDLSLYNWLRFPRPSEEVENMYKRVLDGLIALHVDATRHIDECELLKNRPFDYDYFRWETSYFLERFVQGLCRQQPASPDALDEDFDRLARDADALPKAVIHRDFQSQNIMITNGLPRFIDYQGARMAPPAYDVASALWDPYHRLDDAMRERLLAYYTDLRAQRSGEDFSADSFLDSLAICRLQRHMQALGAYAFLSIEKGKHYFRKHIPEGLRLLKEDVAHITETPNTGTYPALSDLVTSL